jgi:hypothetical protein
MYGFYQKEKRSEETRNEKNVPKHNKTVSDKSITNITLHGEKLKAFPLNTGMRQGVHSPHSFSLVLEFLARAIRQEKK